MEGEIMKKTKIIAGVVILSLVLAGIGYAIWADELSIGTTVSTGILEVEFVESHFPVEVYDAFSDLQVTRDKDTLTVICSNMYPGMYLTICSEMENTGTIPALFDRVTVNFRGNEELKNELFVSMLNFALYDSNDGLLNESLAMYTDFPLSQLEDKLNELLSGVRLEPGEYLVMGGNPSNKTGKSVEPYLDLYVSDDAGSGIEDKTLEFDIIIQWKQFNK